MIENTEKYQIRICPFCGQPMNDRNDAKKYFPQNFDVLDGGVSE